MKKFLVWEKQKLKLQDEIIVEKEKIKVFYKLLVQIIQDEKEIEVWQFFLDCYNFYLRCVFSY